MHDRVRAVDELELVVAPVGPLGPLVLAVADLDRLGLQRLAGSRRVEDELDHLPVALVEVVPVVEDVVEPVLQRELAGVVRVGRDVGVDRRLRLRGRAGSPSRGSRTRGERVAREVEVVAEEPLAEIAGFGRDRRRRRCSRARSARPSARRRARPRRSGRYGLSGSQLPVPATSRTTGA
jgi:hypothetical protein